MKILHKGIISRYAFLFSKLVQKILRAALVSYNTMPMTRHNLIIGQDRINMWSFADMCHQTTNKSRNNNTTAAAFNELICKIILI